MAFDFDELSAAVAKHGVVTRILVAAVKGSAPRGEGTSMLVWQTGQSGTIGGGELEFRITAEARRRLTDEDHSPRFLRYALGPALGQCCGGNVALACETFDATALARLRGARVFVRPTLGTSKSHPAVDRLAAQIERNPGAYNGFAMLFGWIVEPVRTAGRALWVWGAGHVGRAIVSIIAPMPEWDVTWLDVAPDRFPDPLPERVSTIPSDDPARMIPFAPVSAGHLILTYSHQLDFDICHGLLGHGFASAGLIGSATKWMRFKNRLGQLGHTPEQITRIRCPIGDPALGKHPQAIAVGVAADLLRAPAAGKRTLTA